MFDVIAFDADDTLWHTERLYAEAQVKLDQLLSPYIHDQTVEKQLYAMEMNNLETYGYGIKSFTLSMIETSIKVTDGQIAGKEIQQIIEIAREMLNAEVQLLDEVEETIQELAKSYKLMIITKGDLLDQESKLLRSGINQYFEALEVVSKKTADVYRSLLQKHKIETGCFLMVGNSVKSDVLPVLEIGGQAVYIPYHITWAHENVDDQPLDEDGYYQLERIGQLPQLLASIETK
jgi:putative hydrolase of the HAD superfamily